MQLKEFLEIEAKLRKEHPELKNWEIEFILDLVLKGADIQDLEKEVKDGHKGDTDGGEMP